MEDKKQEIISLLNKMDEDELDKLLYLIKHQPKKTTKYIINPSLEVKDIWADVCIAIGRELTEVSYNTWIKNIIPVNIEEKVFTLAVENEFQLGIVRGRYSDLIKTALLYITNIKFELEYVVRN